MPRRRPLLRRPSVWALALLLVALAVAGALMARGPSVPAAVVARRDLEQHLVATGRVLAPARVEVASQFVGVVKSVRVREGDRIHAGDVLVQLDDADADADVRVAQAAVGQAAARAQRFSNVGTVVSAQLLAQAGANLDSAVQKYERAKALFEASAISRQELDDEKRALDVASAAHASALAQKTGASVEAQEARAALDQAEAQLVTAKLRLAEMQLVAPADGVVLTRDVEPGTLAQPSRALLVLSLDGEARLVLEPDERDLSLVALGAEARASADAFPADKFRAIVSYIAPSVDATRGTIEVRLRVPAPPAYLRPDMTVSVDLEVAERSQVLVVATDAVRGLATPAPWALVASHGRVERRNLTLGIRGEDVVEVASGLAEGDLVILPGGQPVQPGDRVRPRRER